MRPPDETRRKIVAEWLRKAELDLDLAKHLLSQGGAFPSAIAFHCQQAVEKYLKAGLAWYQVDFPKTHDLEDLLERLATVNVGLSESLDEVIVLTPYGVELRYPGDLPDATPEEARQAVELAGMAQSAVLRVLSGVLK